MDGGGDALAVYVTAAWAEGDSLEVVVQGRARIYG